MEDHQQQRRLEASAPKVLGVSCASGEVWNGIVGWARGGQQNQARDRNFTSSVQKSACCSITRHQFQANWEASISIVLLKRYENTKNKKNKKSSESTGTFSSWMQLLWPDVEVELSSIQVQKSQDEALVVSPSLSLKFWQLLVTNQNRCLFSAAKASNELRTAEIPGSYSMKRNIWPLSPITSPAPSLFWWPELESRQRKSEWNLEHDRIIIIQDLSPHFRRFDPRQPAGRFLALQAFSCLRMRVQLLLTYANLLNLKARRADSVQPKSTGPDCRIWFGRLLPLQGYHEVSSRATPASAAASRIKASSKASLNRCRNSLATSWCSKSRPKKEER
jgi:hypothetical protein